MERALRIGEVAERTGLTRRTLRHYDELGLLVPSGRSSGDYRLYSPSDLVRLLQIQSLKALGLNLAEIGHALADPNLDATATLTAHREALARRIAAEQQLSDRLAGLARNQQQSWQDVLAAIAAVQLLAHPDPMVRLRAAMELPADPAELLNALRDETDPAVQEMLIWSLVQYPQQAAAVRAELAASTSGYRRALLRAVAKWSDLTAAPAVIDCLSDDDPTVRDQAVDTLGQLVCPEATTALIDLLGGTTVNRDRLITALALHGPAAIAGLVRTLHTGTAAARSAAAECLGLVDEASVDLAIPALRQALTDPDREVRQTALMSLGGLGGRAREALRAAMADPELRPLATRLLEAEAK